MTKLLTAKTLSQKFNLDVRPRTLGLTTLASLFFSPLPSWLVGDNSRFLLF